MEEQMDSFQLMRLVGQLHQIIFTVLMGSTFLLTIHLQISQQVLMP